MQERYGQTPTSADVMRRFRCAYTTSELAKRLPQSDPGLPPASDLAALLTDTDRPFTRALVGAYPRTSRDPFSLRIGDRHIDNLCQTAELRLVRSLEVGACRVGIEPTKHRPAVVVKYLGKLCGLALQDYQLPNGQVLVSGHWYTPIDSATISRLESEFRQEAAAQFSFDHGVWALMRPFQDDNLTLVHFTDTPSEPLTLHTVLASEHMRAVLTRARLPRLLNDGTSVMTPEQYRAEPTHTESIYPNQTTIGKAHQDIVASD